MARDTADRRTLAEIGRAFLEIPLQLNGDWDVPLRRLSEVTGSSQSQFMGLSLVQRGMESVLLNHTTDQHPDAYRDYFTIGADSEDVHWKAGMRSEPLKIVSDRDYAEVRARRGSKDIFTEYLDDYDGYFGCHATLLDDPDAYFVVGTLRSGDKGPISAGELANFSEIVPYVHAAALMQRALEHQGALFTSQTLEAMRAAAFVLDRNGIVRARTAAAEAALSSQQALTSKQGRLRALRRDDDRILQQAIDAALKGAVANRIVLGDGAVSGRFHACEIFALPKREWSFGFEPRVIVVIKSPGDLARPENSVLMRQLGLSNAEAEVALLLADGMSRDEIARCRGTSVATVREQLKSIFAKVDVQREGALIALINRILR